MFWVLLTLAFPVANMRLEALKAASEVRSFSKLSKALLNSSGFEIFSLLHRLTDKVSSTVEKNL